MTVDIEFDMYFLRSFFLCLYFFDETCTEIADTCYYKFLVHESVFPMTHLFQWKNKSFCCFYLTNKNSISLEV
uniref:Uncharacterized protein n=1 Tax=Rhizophora mucronata TaxID=61149 RepID=A0A2P2QMG4_RHIMU